MIPQADKPCAGCVSRMASWPTNYAELDEWLERRSRFDQTQCADCGRWTFWRLRAAVPSNPADTT